MQAFSRVGDPAWTITQECPPIEEIESAAARLRPIFLKEEDVYHYSVISSLGYLARGGSEEARAKIKIAKRVWTETTTNSYWAVQATDTRFKEKMPWTWDRQIARDWLYGYLVHDDEDAQERLKHLSDREKVIAGLLWVKDGILLTRATTQLVDDLEARDELGKS